MSTKDIPSSSPLAILEFGQALYAAANGGGFDFGATTPEAAELNVLEKKAMAFLRGSSEAQKFVSVDDAEELRVLSATLFHCIMVDYLPTVRLVCDMAGSRQVAGVVAAHRALYRLCRRGTIVLADGSPWRWNGTPQFKGSVAAWLGLCGGREPILFSTKTLAGTAPTAAGTFTDELAGEMQGSMDSTTDRIPSAKELYTAMRETCLGRSLDRPCAQLASIFVTHLVRSRIIRADSQAPTPCQVALLIGAPSVGKTYSAETAARVVNRVCGGMAVPFSSFSATDLTAEGYVGCSVEDIFKPVLAACNFDVARARFSVILLDEIDKRACRTSRTSLDVGGRAVQEELLRVLGGATIPVGGRRGGMGDQKTVQFQADGCSFLLSGAFLGLDDLLKGEGHAKPIGFGTDGSTSGRARTRDALVDYGLLPELVSRVGSLITYTPPSRSDLEETLQAPLGMLASYRKLLAGCGMDVSMTPGGIRLIAEYGLSTASYARGMQSVLNRLVEQLVFLARKGAVTLGRANVRDAIASMG